MLIRVSLMTKLNHIHVVSSRGRYSNLVLTISSREEFVTKKPPGGHVFDRLTFLFCFFVTGYLHVKFGSNWPSGI